MRRIISFVLCALIVVSLCACSGETIRSLQDENVSLKSKNYALERQVAQLEKQFETKITEETESARKSGYEIGFQDGYESGVVEGTTRNDRGVISNLSFMTDTPDSSCFSQVGFFEHTLYVTFRETNKSYVYYDLPESVWDSFINSRSLGTYFNNEIKGNYDYGEIIDGTETKNNFFYITEYSEEAAYDAGYEDGYYEGSHEGYSEGYDDGCNSGYDDGYDNGYDEGYDEGYDDGYDDGYDE